MIKRKYLQKLMNEKSLIHPDIGEWRVEYRCFKGWYAVPDEPRYIGDDGELLGSNWKIASSTIERYF